MNVNRAQHVPYSKGTTPLAHTIRMAGDSSQGPTAKLTRAKKRIVTSCLECYRRKQKCDRKKPCNFCSARRLPHICQYDTSPDAAGKTNHRNIVQAPYPSKSLEATLPSIEPDSKSNLIDQVGYSSLLQRDNLLLLNEYDSYPILNDTATDQIVTIANATRYLELVSQLPSESATATLIKAFFAVESWSIPILDEPRFHILHQCFQNFIGVIKSVKKPSLGISSALSTFPALLFSVLAVALQIVPPDSASARALDLDTTAQCDAVSACYMDNAQAFIESFKRQKPTTTTIQFHLAKTLWQKNYGRGSESWQTLGVAIRQAQEIDLHQIQDVGVQDPDVPLGQTLTRMWEQEHNKRLWFRLFVMDSHMAVSLGRPRGIHREDCSTPMPLDCEYPINPAQTVPMSTNHSREPPNSFSPIIFSIALGHKYHDLMSLRSTKLDLMDYSRVQALHEEVQQLLSDLPPALRPSYPDTTWDVQKLHLPAIRQRLLTTTNIFLLALHRPLVGTHIASRYSAIDAAFELLQSQQRLFGMIHSAQYKLYGHSFYTLHTSIFLTTLVVKYFTTDPDTCARALQELRQATIRLGCMRDRSPIAKTGEKVLHQCCAVIEAKAVLPFTINSPGESDNDDRITTAIDFFQSLGTDMSQETQDLVSLLAIPADSAINWQV